MALNPDALSQVLGLMRLRGRVFFETRLTPPFSLAIRREGYVASFHLALDGDFWVTIGGGKSPINMKAGDLILITHGEGHAVSDEPGRPAEPFEKALDRAAYPGFGTFVLGSGGYEDQVRLLCGQFEFDDGILHPVLSSLPEYIHLPGHQTSNNLWLAPIMSFVGNELATAQPGAEVIVHRLTEIIFVQTLRTFASHAGEAAGCLAGVLDPRLGRALTAMHGAPARNWSVEELAQIAGLSRTRFAERFTKLIGLPPIGLFHVMAYACGAPPASGYNASCYRNCS